MTKLPIFSGRAIIKILEKIGYRQIRQRGSHIRLICPGKKSVTVPDYKIVSSGLLRKIIRDIEISRKELERLMKTK